MLLYNKQHQQQQQCMIYAAKMIKCGTTDMLLTCTLPVISVQHQADPVLCFCS